ncbi:MAG: OmpA family protein [Burkholderiaceae bacterium]|jgi:outer membrane protein OmpA-like peptidoglycan-associated protein|nr:OmpA family protein [Burkholderiaceae bacterium]
MAHDQRIHAAALGVLIALGALSGGAQAQPGRYDFDRGDQPYDLRGPGVRELLPELRDTPRGRAFVMRNFDFDRNGIIMPHEAREANRAFIQVAGRERHRFDWDQPPARFVVVPPPPPPVVVPPPPPPDARAMEGYDRRAMRRYHFREGRYGAVFDLGDVLFETGSAKLKHDAFEQLRPLADYLRARRGVRLRIDGYTDSVGSAASNLTLSQNRAQSVADALSVMGAESHRFRLEGHGAASPRAPNTTAAGRQQNRRVEITIVGQRASSFN